MKLEVLERLELEGRRVAERLRLPLGSRVWRGQTGEFRGGGVGSSVDFQDHRAYVVGDDPRHINWQAYARTGEYSMKLYREEVRPLVDVVVDVSDSMWLDLKGKRLGELVYFLVNGVGQVGASLRVWMVKGGEFCEMELDGVLGHGWVKESQSLSGAEEEVPDLSRLGLRSGAMRVLVSDLLFEGDPGGMIRSLGDRGGSGLLIVPFAREEEDPGWDGSYDFIDAELRTKHPYEVGAGVLERYLASYRRHMALWREECLKGQVTMMRVRVEGGLYESLVEEGLRVGGLEVVP